MSETVTLHLPAATAYVAVARSVAAAMCARADLPIDQLEDVRLAVDEALTQAIAEASSADAVIGVEFRLVESGLDIRVSVPSATGALPPTTTFSWVVMEALVDGASAAVADGVLTLHLRVTRALPVEA